MKKYLLDQLTEYTNSDAYPLHMPGHKRQMRLLEHPYEIDITEIEGFDNLHHPEGILKEAQERAARLYGADETFFLVNGSTGGILAAISAAVPRGGRILMARDSHKSAFHAALINGLHVTWLYPDMDMRRGIYGSIRPEQVREALKFNDSYSPTSLAVMNDAEMGTASGNSSLAAPSCAERMRMDGATCRLAKRESATTVNDAGEVSVQAEGRGACRNRIAAVFVTSPTYDGVVSDIRAIAEEVHRAGAILIVDEAHGAHFAMHPYFPESALALGADLVINSLHKTMPSLTQTALLHVRGGRIDRDRLRFFLGVYQSSSPSYVLMAGMDECVRLMESRRQELFDAFVRRLTALRRSLGRMKVLHLVTGEEPELNAFAFDRSKLLISTELVDASDRTIICREIDAVHGCTDEVVCEGAGSLVDHTNNRIADGIADECATGAGLAQILRTCYHLEVEMASEHYVTAILTVADTQEGFDRLEAALLEIDAQLFEGRSVTDAGILESVSESQLSRESVSEGQQMREPLPGDQQLWELLSDDQQSREPLSGDQQPQEPEADGLQQDSTLLHPEAVMTMTEADGLPREPVPLEKSPGRIAAEAVYLYPPGIPLLVPGERVPNELPELLARVQVMGLQVQGMANYSAGTLLCLTV